MRQLVDLSCALCGGRIGSVIDGRFCESCGCPVHMKCDSPAPATEQGPSCPACSARSALAEREQQLHREHAEQRKGLVSKEEAEREGYTPPAAPNPLKWVAGMLGFSIMSISALVSTLDPKEELRLLNTVPALGFDIFLPVGLLGIGFCLFNLARGRQ